MADRYDLAKDNVPEEDQVAELYAAQEETRVVSDSENDWPMETRVIFESGSSRWFILTRTRTEVDSGEWDEWESVQEVEQLGPNASRNSRVYFPNKDAAIAWATEKGLL